MSEPREPIPVFVPALSAVLVAAEDQKTEPLDEAEVLELRDSAACVMMEEADAAKMVESRGYVDIDPENCWYDWQMLRRELGRKPDLDPGARVDRFNSTDATYQLTIERAQETLVDFRDMIARSEDWLPLIKTEVSNPHSEGRCFIWLNNVKATTDGFVAQVFEIPATLQGFEVGDTIEVLACEVLDWMINADGTLHGGFSIRYHRERLPEHERDAFDTHIGVTTYA